MVKPGKRSVESSFVQYADSQWADDEGAEHNTCGVDKLPLGDEDIFYVKLYDGEKRWRVSDSLADVLEERSSSKDRGVVG